ncbi:GntR family transcriptional regulator [Nocardioides mangrovicus]|uniref:GntR family transcriptional regulator n=1 Tax=Nocardioides mangrovicus TaxID=2478913 RepID=UPI001E4312EA|nr:GntR family transcriptional regulator [Nocardioides mangrovicus]
MSSFSHLSLDPETTVDKIAAELRRALFDGELEPGTPLREVALADSLGVARSTVREALGSLVADGLAVRVANKGVAVSTPDPGVIHDVTRARTVLEVAGVRRWAEAAETDRQAVRDALAAYAELASTDFTTAAWNQAHLAIHRAFVGLTGSERLVAAADALAGEIRLALAKVDRTRRNATEQVASHALLVDLLEAGRTDDAADELVRHLADGETSMAAALT